MADIGIIDYGMGNLGSVVNACPFLGLDAAILESPDDLASCRGIILPGQGAFGDCMAHIDRHGYRVPLCDWAAADRPFLGICIGLQVLFESSEESPASAGLGIFRGSVRRFPASPGLKIPQMGWNRVYPTRPGIPCLDGIDDGAHFYFVHSYYVDTPETDLVASEPEYGFRIQTPVLGGEAGFTFHKRKADPGVYAPIYSRASIDEERFGFDGRWDTAAGIWLEATLIRQNPAPAGYSVRRMIMAGMDYTAGVGNGLLITGEHLDVQAARSALAAGERYSLTAVSANYPLNLLDSVTGIVYYDWENRNWYRFINLQRRYDKWEFFIMAFWNPDSFHMYRSLREDNLFGGKGIQLMAVFNH